MAALAALLLAGCAAPPGPPSSPATAAGADLVLSGCRGAAVELYGAAGTFPAGGPAGWQAQDKPVTGVRWLLLECARVAWGAFERGPVFVAQEWRDDVDPPPRCLQGWGDRYDLLESIWFSDADLAQHAQAQGMPAHLGAFAVGRQAPAGGVAVEEWSWGPPGQQPSSASLPEAPGRQEQSSLQARRLFWADGDGVGRLDVRSTSSADQADPRLAWGALRPPTLHGRASLLPAFVSTGAALLDGVESSATLQRFGDTGCEQPL